MRATKLCVIVLTAFAALYLSGCNEKPGSKLLAKVNGVPLTEEDLKFQLKKGHSDPPPQYGAKNVDDIVDQELLYQQGIRLGLDRDPSYRQKLAAFSGQPAAAKRQEMARRVFNTQIAATIDVRPEEAKEYYQRNRERIRTELHLLMARFDTRQQADEALQKLKQGAQFAEIARQALKRPPAAGSEPWDLGFVKWQQIPVDFVDQLYSLKPGELSAPLGSHRTGFQIVKLLERRQMPDQGYGAVSAAVTNRLRDERLLTAYNRYLAMLKNDANIVTF